ncbi:MAG: hypothetical protein LQ337_007007 [Flavoplaca oasis]|nr:MAG: hypothetical protein LQ337_007007 [Flavoplaca oasis]
MITEKQEREYILPYHEHGQTEERPKYYEVLKAQLEDEVKAELRKELEPTVRADVREHHLASLREEVSRAFVHGISQFQRPSRFAENVIGPRLRAKYSEREEDADQYHNGLAQDALDKVTGASNRLNSVLHDGPPIESSKATDTWPPGAYQGSLFGIYPHNLQVHEYPNQPQLVPSSYAQNATAGQSSASGDDRNLGRLVRRPRTQALKNHATTTRSAEAPINQSHQPTP